MGRTLGMLASFLAAGALAAGCGDTLVDHGSTDLVETLCEDRTATCQVNGELRCVEETPTQCGQTCADCTASSPPAGAIPACLPPAGGGQSACGFECTGGRLRCGDGCCEATAVAAGAWHTCAITSAGSLVCWGDDEWGQVTGVPGAKAVTPPTVAGPRDAPFTAGVTAVATGQRHTCAVVGGVVRCLGWNDDGQAPSTVAGLSGVVALAAGQRHTCALGAGGAVQCWGANSLGQRGAVNGPAIPSGAERLSAGRDHTCAVMTSGAVRCWGSNESGQLGDGTQAGTGPTTPAVGNANRFVAAGHSHTCSAADTEGRPDTGNVFDAVRCWGAQPGPLFGLLAPQPTPAIPLKDVDQSVIRFAPLGIATGESHVCVLGDDEVAGIHCFGPDNAAGQLGTNADPASEAVGIPSSQGARAIAAGDDHACAIWSDGGVRCWGSNVFGELGTGDAAPVDRGVIVQVSGR